VLAYNPGVPETSPIVPRAEADRCPGVLRLTEAADGLLARVRLPGGLITAEQLRALARTADGRGDGRVELTSRGNVQLRGLTADDAEPLTSELITAGLLPSLSHDRVRNVLASPLAGLDRGADLTGIVRALDAALCARPRLAGLSGRFLFVVDDGRGDVAGHGGDVVAVIRPGGAVVNGLWVRDDGVVAAMLACAEAFLDLRAESGGTAWRIADLPGGGARVRDLVAARLAGVECANDHDRSSRKRKRPAGNDWAASRPVGLIAETSVVLLAPLGRATTAQLRWVADQVAADAARVTPWRSVVLPRLPDAARVLGEAAGLGFGTDEGSPWRRVTACAGRPGCASALADVQADAAGLAERWPGRLVHVSGCERHCGRPAATEIDVTATSEGYEVAGV
jgi:precorrin-3B synthase